MKVTVSIADSIFEEAEKLATRLGATRSALYRKALESYVRKFREQELTQRINEVCAEVDTSLPEDLERAVISTLREG